MEYQTIGEFTKYLKLMFDTSSKMKHVMLKGEISNFKGHSTGHLYFSLKDDTAKINAIMFSGNAKKLTFEPTEGMKVLVIGRISIYEATGSYQVYVEDMQEDGIGNLHLEFEKLKKKLYQEGLFDPSHKRPIPKYPHKIGVITAKTGAAIRDIISTIQRRYPIAEIYLFSSLVQGDGAKDDIVKKIAQANTYDMDVLIVGRGGGSIEDLWPFNEEIVARAIYNSRIPVISAVGHEIDFTIADFVADLRAPTPTGAAELAVPNIVDVIKNINQLEIRLNEGINKTVRMKKLYLESIKNSYVIKNPMLMYDNKEQKLLMMMDKIDSLININIKDKKNLLSNLKNSYLFINPSEIYKKDTILLNHIIEKLDLINPLKVLKRGYSVTYKNDKIVDTISNINKDDIVKIVLTDGLINTRVIDKELNNGKD